MKESCKKKSENITKLTSSHVFVLFFITVSALFLVFLLRKPLEIAPARNCRLMTQIPNNY